MHGLNRYKPCVKQGIQSKYEAPPIARGLRALVPGEQAPASGRIRTICGHSDAFTQRLRVKRAHTMGQVMKSCCSGPGVLPKPDALLIIKP